LNAQLTTIREIILERIASILQSVYKDPAIDLSEETLIAKLSFKADPQLNELRLALERMVREEYGRCIFCKGPIADELLKTDPTAHFCHQCAGILRYRTSLPRVEYVANMAKNFSPSPMNSTSISG
jgi:RNA polymerase-binding transcription factor DksA